jgi:CelD/BcsL family acetyltransferase involved in cellulose biosynthesis
MATTTESIDDPGQFAALREEWRELLGDSQTEGLFLTWQWLFTWWKHLRGERRLALIIVREGRDLIGLAPLALRPARLAGLSGPTLEFLGSGMVGSDYLDVILRRGREREALEALAEVLVARSYRLDFRRVRADSAARRLAVQLGARGWLTAETSSETCPFIELGGHTWESYLATLGPNHRYNVRRRLRQAMARRLEVHVARTADECRDTFPIFADLHQRRWGDRTEAIGSPALIAFHEDISAVALGQGWLRLSVLSLEGRAAAAVYGFRYDGTYYYYQSGFDPARAQQSPGLLALALSIQAALEEGVHEYDLLHGDESYKSLWARQARAVSRLEVYPGTVRETVSARARAAGRAARRVARHVLPTTVSTRLSQARRRQCLESM